MMAGLIPALASTEGVLLWITTSFRDELNPQHGLWVLIYVPFILGGNQNHNPSLLGFDSAS